MIKQADTSKWDYGKPSTKLRYRITSKNSMQFGPDKWAVVFSDDFKSFKGKGAGKKHRITGKLKGRLGNN